MDHGGGGPPRQGAEPAPSFTVSDDYPGAARKAGLPCLLPASSGLFDLHDFATQDL
jgi:hypothetical protein